MMFRHITLFFTSETVAETNLLDPVKGSYKLLSELAKARDIEIRFVVGADHYVHETIDSYWIFDDEKLIEIKESYRPTVVYLKNRTEILDSLPRVNSPYLEKICRDKLLTYQMFPTLVKKTITADAIDEKILTVLNTDQVIAKPRFGLGGEDITLLKKEEIILNNEDTENIVIQEVIDSSNGIPNLINKRHELRIYVFNGEIRCGYLRIPPPDSIVANVAQGATVELLKLADIPESAYTIKNTIDAAFTSVEPRIYTIDVMYENGVPWVIELNDMPGFPYPDVQPLATEFMEAVLDTLTPYVSSK